MEIFILITLFILSICLVIIFSIGTLQLILGELKGWKDASLYLGIITLTEISILACIFQSFLLLS
jgi:hypothetical protein